MNSGGEDIQPDNSGYSSSAVTPISERSPDMSTVPSASSDSTTLIAPAAMKGKYTQDRALEDVPGAAYALNLFLASQMVESEEYCHMCDPTK